MSKTKHFAFTFEYPGLSLNLVTPVNIYPVATKRADLCCKPYEIRAIWDTGATHTVITPRVKDALMLFAVDEKHIRGVNSAGKAEVSLVPIVLPNHVQLDNRNVTIAELNSEGIDMLIGMDIILLGDFAISNAENKTMFSFAIPSFPNKINLVDKANKVNSR